jgi:hypothetical protein
MGVDHPERDQHRDDQSRAETETERLDRNWSTLLQELRVTQTGVQLLTGFLLTLPFQQRFDRLDELMRGVYAATVACSVAATLALVAPLRCTGSCSASTGSRPWCRPRTGWPMPGSCCWVWLWWA